MSLSVIYWRDIVRRHTPHMQYVQHQKASTRNAAYLDGASARNTGKDLISLNLHESNGLRQSP